MGLVAEPALAEYQSLVAAAAAVEVFIVVGSLLKFDAGATQLECGLAAAAVVVVEVLAAGDPQSSQVSLLSVVLSVPVVAAGTDDEAYRFAAPKPLLLLLLSLPMGMGAAVEL